MSAGSWPSFPTGINPLIRKGIQERLRLKQLIAWGLFALIITSFVYMIAYLEGREDRGYYDYDLEKFVETEPSDVNGAKSAFPLLLSVQGFILMFLGTGRMAAGTAEERETGLLDYQRMTPMRPFSKIVGYLFGLPAREYYMFALTLPFLAHAVIVGELAIGKTAHLYGVFFSCVLLYHLTAHVTGLIVNKPRAASWISRIVVLGLYVALPVFGQAGLSFLSFLTLLPTYLGIMSEELQQTGNLETGSGTGEMATFWNEVPFFETTISASFFTVLMQGLLLAALFSAAHRKWRNESLPAFSKPFGIGLFIILQVLLLGSLWQLYGEGLASGLLGTFFSKNSPLLDDPGLVLIVVQVILFTFCLATAVFILHVTCPTRHRYLKGRRRSAKLGLPDIPLLADEKPGLIVALCLALIMPLTQFVLLTRAGESGLYFEKSPDLETYILPCLFFVACIVYVRAARERWFAIGFWGFLGLLWVTPLLICLVLAVGWQEDALEAIFYIGSLSPPFAFFEIVALTHDPDLLDVLYTQKSALLNGTIFGLSVACALAVFLSVSQFRLCRSWDEREKSVAGEREA